MSLDLKNMPKRRHSKVNNSVQVKGGEGLKAKLAEMQNSDCNLPAVLTSIDSDQDRQMTPSRSPQAKKVLNIPRHQSPEAKAVKQKNDEKEKHRRKSRNRAIGIHSPMGPMLEKHESFDINVNVKNMTMKNCRKRDSKS